MDYETKIYLDKLIEAVDSPDWWMIVLTIINVGAFIIVAYTQYKQQKYQIRLQEQQTKLMDYDINKQLYSVIKDIDELSDTIIVRIYNHFMGIIFVSFNRDLLTEVQEEIANVQERFNKSILDFELKFSDDMKDLYSYQTLIKQMRMLILSMKQMEKDKIIERKVGDAKQFDNNSLVQAIIERIPEDFSKVTKVMFDDFLKVKKQVRSQNTLDKIKKRITSIIA